MIFQIFEENLAPNNPSQITKNEDNILFYFYFFGPFFSGAQPIINHHKGQKKKFSRSKKKELKKNQLPEFLVFTMNCG